MHKRMYKNEIAVSAVKNGLVNYLLFMWCNIATG